MSAGQWTFLSNHSHVLVCIARDPLVRVRDMALQIGITERAVLRILGELKDAGFVLHERIGRRNQYSIAMDKELRHDLEQGVTVRDLLSELVPRSALNSASASKKRRTAAGRASKERGAKA